MNFDRDDLMYKTYESKSNQQSITEKMNLVQKETIEYHDTLDTVQDDADDQGTPLFDGDEPEKSHKKKDLNIS